MAIAKMTLVTLTGAVDQMDAVIERFSRFMDFHHEEPKNPAQNAPQETANPYEPLLEQIQRLRLKHSLSVDFQPGSYRDIPLEQVRGFLNQAERTLEELSQRRSQLHDSLDQRRQSLSFIQHLQKLDVSFDALFSCQYLKIRFGRLPLEGYDKLRHYSQLYFFEDQIHLFYDLDRDKEYVYGALFLPHDQVEAVDNVFSELGFERIYVPEYIHDEPEKSILALKEQIAREERQLEEAEAALADFCSRNREKLSSCYAVVKLRRQAYRLKQYALVQNQQFYLTGFILQNREQAFRQCFEGSGAKIDFRPADSDPRMTPPTVLKNNRFSQAFEFFVTMYGLPGHNEIDPTPYMAVTYTLLFGVMFGDLGQGLAVVLIGWLMWRLKRMEVGRVLMRCGVSSALFGCVYGSVFGFEHLLDPMYRAMGFAQKPVDVFETDTTTLLLLGAVGVGAALLLVSMLMNVIVGLRQKDYGKALFSSNGVAGLLLYGTVLIGAALLLGFGVNIFHPAVVLLLIVLPLLLMFLKEPLAARLEGRSALLGQTVGGFIVENFFELFDILLSFVTNTMSFLRVGGFILSHAGMMLVVHTLAEMVGAGASPVVLVFGNLFVMGMEGLIVCIQVLRLEFYEIFSRFFEGSGKPFVPVASQEEA